MSEIGMKETTEVKKPEVENYKEIKPDSGITVSEAKDFWDNKFTSMEEKVNNKETDHSDSQEGKNHENETKDLNECVNDYFDDIRSKSECPDTLPEKPFNASELKQRSPEENSKMREEFDDMKSDLKRQWEEKNGQEWPKYKEDVYSESEKLIRKAGSDYDAHHIHPLSLGGRNEVDNITPLHAQNHYDKQGVHSPDSPYSRITQFFGGAEK